MDYELLVCASKLMIISRHFYSYEAGRFPVFERDGQLYKRDGRKSTHATVVKLLLRKDQASHNQIECYRQQDLPTADNLELKQAITPCPFRPKC